MELAGHHDQRTRLLTAWLFPKSKVLHWSSTASPRRHEPHLHFNMHLEKELGAFLPRTSGNMPSLLPLSPESLSHCSRNCLIDGRPRSLALWSPGMKENNSFARSSESSLRNLLTQRNLVAVSPFGGVDFSFGGFCAWIFPVERNNSVMYSTRLIGRLVLERCCGCYDYRYAPLFVWKRGSIHLCWSRSHGCLM